MLIYLQKKTIKNIWLSNYPKTTDSAIISTLITLTLSFSEQHFRIKSGNQLAPLEKSE